MHITNIANNPATAEGALVLFSGGQDSATCLAWALERFERVETIAFDYGQRNRGELDCRKELMRGLASLTPTWAARLGEDHTIDLASLGQISETALTREAEIKYADDGMCTTFVPGRNLVFLTYAAAVAYRRGHRHIVAGVCGLFPSGYPDCQDDAIKAMQVALNLGMRQRFVLHTPRMWLDKAATWAMAFDLGGQALVDLIVEHTLSCFVGDREHRHPWGYGCGVCPACEQRAEGFVEFHKQHQLQAMAD